jgi:hypothetical protein
MAGIQRRHGKKTWAYRRDRKVRARLREMLANVDPATPVGALGGINGAGRNGQVGQHGLSVGERCREQVARSPALHLPSPASLSRESPGTSCAPSGQLSAAFKPVPASTNYIHNPSMLFHECSGAAFAADGEEQTALPSGLAINTTVQNPQVSIERQGLSRVEENNATFNSASFPHNPLAEASQALSTAQEIGPLLRDVTPLLKEALPMVQEVMPLLKEALPLLQDFMSLILDSASRLQTLLSDSPPDSPAEEASAFVSTGNATWVTSPARDPRRIPSRLSGRQR